MKNITKSLLLALFGVLAFSCSSDDIEDRPVIIPGDAPVLSAPEDGNAYVLTIENAAEQAERFVWSAASFGQDVAINYSVEIDKAGNEFANPQVLGSVIGQYQLPVTVESLNGAVLLAGGEAFVAGDYEVRVKASVNDTFEPIYSNVNTITVTPYVSVAPPLYFVGAPQAYYNLNGWDNTTAIEMRYIGDGVTRVYEAYVKVNAGDGFKFIGEQGTWDNGNYGVIGGVQDGNLENSGGSGDVKVAETDGPGLYYIQVDIDQLKYKSVKMNWGIIGAATPSGWGGETAMTYDFANNQFTIDVTLTQDNMKFRCKNAGDFIYNNEWAFQTGNSDPKVAYDNGSGDIAVQAGATTITYAVGFDGVVTVTGI